MKTTTRSAARRGVHPIFVSLLLALPVVLVILEVHGEIRAASDQIHHLKSSRNTTLSNAGVGIKKRRLAQPEPSPPPLVYGIGGSSTKQDQDDQRENKSVIIKSNPGKNAGTGGGQQQQQQVPSTTRQYTSSSELLEDIFGPPDELDVEVDVSIGNGGGGGGDSDVDSPRQDDNNNDNDNSNDCLIIVDECCRDEDCLGIDSICSTNRECVPNQSTPSQDPLPTPTTGDNNNNNNNSNPPTPTSPSTENPGEESGLCLVPLNECCETKDCLFDDEICVHRNCIDDGFVRITLFWEGNDDYDLFVQTPDGAELSFNNFFDPVSLGRFGEEADQFGQGFHVENVFFPRNGAPPGRYTFFVRPLTTVDTSDEWTVHVVEDGTVVITESGFGISNQFEYFRQATAPSEESSPPSPSRPPLGGRPTAPSPSPPTAISPTLPPVSNTPVNETPVGVPTRPPQSLDDCTVFSDECCVEDDCRTGNSVCEQRTCLQDGNPRFTLIWTGDDDLNLIVRTPDGVEISADNTFDQFSGGRYERDVDQTGFDYHVENVYFSILGAPLGTYEYDVRSAALRDGSDTWYIEIWEGGKIIDTRSGSGESSTFSYIRRNAIDGPQRPRPEPPRCSPLEYECCVDSDCVGVAELCLQRTCINEGSLRVSMTWIGDDDLDLSVRTPEKAVISRTSEFDPVSSGRYGDGGRQTDFDFHVENIHFPLSGAPLGTYEFFVESSAIRGVGADIWTITVYESGETRQVETGIGDSAVFRYERVFLPTLPTSPNPPPQIQPSPVLPPSPANPLLPTPYVRLCPDRYGCCSKNDCLGSVAQVCEQRTCILDGPLRIDLTWTGDDDLSLVVSTPKGDSISFQNPVDESTGGSLSRDSTQDQFGFHIESVAFPLEGSLPGNYSYFIRVSELRGAEDRWTLRVHKSGSLVDVKSGTGDSITFTYLYDGTVGPITTSPPVSPPIQLPARPPIGSTPAPTIFVPTDVSPGSCLEDADCGANQQCVQQTCIFRGNPQVVLTWTGDDDLDLFLIIPGQPDNPIWSENVEVSGGRFDGIGVQDTAGAHVENIYFAPSPGPPGTYAYYVHSFRSTNEDDVWTVTVYVDGQVISEDSGQGSSDIHLFDFDNDGQPTSPPISPEPAAPSQGICNPTVNECCTNAACLPDEQCTFRQCVNEGSPRFTLFWEGGDDLDLLVLTPLGTVVSFANREDIASGGIFGPKDADQYDFGQHVENTYFPVDGGPLGTYKYQVHSFLVEGVDDEWTVRVYVNGQLESSIRGTGDSGELTYVYLGLPPTQEPVLPPPMTPTLAPVGVDCDLQEGEECCTNAQCIVGVETCTQQACIDIGVLRFTLIWNGDDDIDLSLVTPFGDTISFVEPIDVNTGGVFGEEGGVQFTDGNHVENIFFESRSIPLGEYRYSVRQFTPRGGEDDEWTVIVYINDFPVDTQTGLGDSDTFSFFLQEGDLESIAGPTPSPECIPGSDECCLDSDCPSESQLCLLNSCLSKGLPRFTLQYEGDDQVELSVVTPFGSTLSESNTNEILSGGTFEEIGPAPGVFGKRVVNIYFPNEGGGPSGTYTYRVSTPAFGQNGDPDVWTVSVYEGDIEVFATDGTGDANFLYEFNPSGSPMPVPTDPPAMDPPTVETFPPVIQCEIPADECCDDTDCPGSQLCVQRQCIDDGSPRFTLTWIGATDYDLRVTPPTGNTISLVNQNDEMSGGVFGENGVQVFFGLHVENVFFSQGGPLGTYEAEVQVFENSQETPMDSWTLQVYAGAQLLQTESGTGSSGVLPFDYQPGEESGRVVTTAAVDNTNNKNSNDCTPVSGGNSCCRAEDCTLPEHDLCVASTCIGGAGKSRFTLTWHGDDDLDLILQLPSGRNVSVSEGPRDALDGVVEASDSSSLNFATTGPHVESIYFPHGCPTGTYWFFVESFWQIGEADPWTVQVFIDGMPMMEPISGTGTSSALQYDHLLAEPPEMSTATGSSSFAISGIGVGGASVSSCNKGEEGC